MSAARRGAGAAARATGASVTDDDLRALVFRSCVLLDDERFEDYLGLYSPAGRYRVTSWSPDIRKELVLLDLEREDFHHLLENIPNHERMLGRFSRHLTGQLVERDAGKDRARVTSSLIVMFTDLDGVTRVFAVGKYDDVVDLAGDAPLIERREVRLDTREFGPGSHVPL